MKLTNTELQAQVLVCIHFAKLAVDLRMNESMTNDANKRDNGLSVV